MPCYYPRSHLHSSWTSPCPPPLPRPGPPFLITIPLKWLFLSENDHVPCPLSLCLLFGGLLSIFLSPLPLLLPLITRAWASNWPQSPPPWVWATGARGQRKYPHIPPSFLDFLPMKCLVLNYSHPTLIIIDWNSQGSGRVTDRLGSLWACPPRRRARWRRRNRGGFCARQPKVTCEHYLQSFIGLLLVRLGHMHVAKMQKLLKTTLGSLYTFLIALTWIYNQGSKVSQKTVKVCCF